MTIREPPIRGSVVVSAVDLQARLDQARSRVAYEESRKIESDRRLQAAREAFLRIVTLGGTIIGSPDAARGDNSAQMCRIAREALELIGDPRDASGARTRSPDRPPAGTSVNL